MEAPPTSPQTHTVIADAVLAFAVFWFAFAGTTHGLLGLVMALAFALPVAWRRIAPDIATLAVVPVFLVQLVYATDPTSGIVVAPLMMYAVAAYGRERWTQPWLAFGLVAAVLAGLRWAGGAGGNSSWLIALIGITGTCAAIVAAAWSMGSLRRSQLERHQALAGRAAALQREHLQAVELAATTERQRIARELHDIIAHSLSVIVVQADGARYVLAEAPGDPAERLTAATRAVDTITATARSALGETRRLVGVLHRDEQAELAPTEGLADIPALVERLSHAGRRIWLTAEGTPAAHPMLGPVAELTAYRVVQESLTNVLKHAGPDAAAWVVLQHHPDGLSIAVRDDGPGSTGGDGQGHGISGLAERVGSLGGSLFARNIPTGGFEITAHLPAAPQGEQWRQPPTSLGRA